MQFIQRYWSIARNVQCSMQISGKSNVLCVDARFVCRWWTTNDYSILRSTLLCILRQSSPISDTQKNVSYLLPTVFFPFFLFQCSNTNVSQLYVRMHCGNRLTFEMILFNWNDLNCILWPSAFHTWMFVMLTIWQFKIWHNVSRAHLISNIACYL